jgi:hypothetical protein
MAAKKSTKRIGAAAPSDGPSAARALAGKAAARGREWDPSQQDPQAAAATMVEVKEPRPYTSRYPIPDAKFEALKAAAPKAKLAKVVAEACKDTGKKKAELGALGMAAAALAPGLPPAAAPTGSVNFAGIASTGWLPPDCTMAAGPDHVLLSVNSSMAIYSKAGGAALLQRTLTQWFGSAAAGLTVFDPKALYDQHAGRWVLLAVGVSNSPKKSVYLLSVSNGANPLGPWRNYSFNAMVDGTTATNNWADYPGLGVDAAALYVTSNQFAFGGGFQYAKIRVIPKLGPYSGGPAPFFDFVNLKNADNSVAFTIQPCHTFGAPQVEYLVNSKFPSGNVLTVWSITNAAILPSLTRKQVTVSPYSLAPNADQKGGAPPLNTGDVRVLHAVFRGDSLWCAFTTAHNWGGASNRATIQWCQIRAAGPTVIQQGVYGTSVAHYFFPACCPDNNGNMTMVFSFSSTTRFGGILYTGRRSTDPLGTLQPSALLKEGVAHYVLLDSGGRNRWGDYNGIAADPANGRVIWFYSEYASAVNTWGTWTGSAFL